MTENMLIDALHKITTIQMSAVACRVIASKAIEDYERSAKARTAAKTGKPHEEALPEWREWCKVHRR